MASTVARPSSNGAKTLLGRVCPYCSGSKFSLLLDGVRDRLGYVEGQWKFWKCVECGSAIIDPLPDIDNLGALYPPVYTYSPALAKQSFAGRLQAAIEYNLFFRPQYVAQVNRVLRNTVGDGRGKRLLDLGCGRGLRLVEFRKRGCEVHGIDLQQQVVDYLNKDLKIPAVCGDVSELDRHFELGSFDVVTAFHLVEHVPEPAALIADVKRYLKPGGWFVAAVPLIDSIQAKLFGRRWVGVSEAPRHLSIPSQAGLARVCRELGFGRVFWRPDSLFNCAGIASLSFIPSAATTATAGRGIIRNTFVRMMSAGLTFSMLPEGAIENYAFSRMAAGIMFAQSL
jgi:SAM-dependent methyltransferase